MLLGNNQYNDFQIADWPETIRPQAAALLDAEPNVREKQSDFGNILSPREITNPRRQFCYYAAIRRTTWPVCALRTWCAS
jgi:hypothetical protein